ncbi:hemerythrin domain-containing protein [Clostridium minihomine]|uniref:hemerythrin domain-containing protein n=1 Tax=Clostridium minihomine TaxID=2045012 RepID=UPI000C7898C9|nr:hemerythrin domain-containing protein [Clostridium minihomine]
MGNLTNLKKQHTEVLELIKNIEKLSYPNMKEEAASEIAYCINTLSGKLKMHLLSEDKFLYPHLLNHQNKAIKDTAHRFNTEMSGLSEQLKDFVSQYNTPAKILQNKNEFMAKSPEVFRLIRERIKKEDHDLYPLLDESSF